MKKKLCLVLVLVLNVLFIGACSKTSDELKVTQIEFNINDMITEYALNEDLNTAGAFVNISYSDFTKETIPVSKDMVSGFDSSKIGYNTVVISYNDIKIDVKLRIKNTQEIDFYITTGTLPTLYAGLNMIASGNESYFIYDRLGTFDDEKFTSNVKWIGYAAESVNMYKMKQLIAKNFTENKDSFFNLYCDDLRVQWEIQMLVENFIPESQYRVVLLSDGIDTYSRCFDKIYANDNSYPVLESNMNKYVEAKEKAQNCESTGLSFEIGSHDLDLAIIRAAQNENFEYWLQYPEYYKSLDEKVQNEIDKTNMVKKEPNRMFEKLSEEQKTIFFETVKIDKKLFDSFFDKSDKPDLLISGASVTSSGDFKGYMQWVIDNYGIEYDLFFKPHPNFLPISGGVIDKDFLDENSIDILPGRLPMEALLWCYPNVKIGGYKSSLYMSASSEQVLFFLNAKSGGELPAPLNTLVDKGLFKDAKFISL